MSVPLLLSYPIKYPISLFHPGGIYLFFYTWALLSVVVVPILILINIILICIGEIDLRWNVFSLSVAIISEVVFLIVRKLPP